MTDFAPRDDAPAEYRDSVGFVLRLARAMHAYGYPTDHVERALEDLSRRLHLTAQFFSTPTSFMAAFGVLEHQATYLIRVEPSEVDLGRGAEIEEVIHEVVAGRLTLSEASDALDLVHTAPRRYKPVVTVLALGLGSTATSRFLGGGIREAIVAGMIGLGVGALRLLSWRSPTLGRVFPFVAAFCASFIAATVSIFLPHYSVYVGTLAGLVVLLPGLTLTTAMTELSSGHLASGTARLSGALMLFLIIGFGVAIGGQTVTLLLGTYAQVRPEPLPDWTWWVALIVAPLSFVILLRAHLRDAGWILLASTLGMVANRVGSATFGPQIGAFIGAISVGVASNVYAYLIRRPAFVPLVPGLLLLVPGSVGFRSLSSLVDREVLTGVETAFTMALIGAGLVAGLLLANVLVSDRQTPKG